MQWVDGFILVIVISLLLFALWATIRRFKGDCSCHKCSETKEGRYRNNM